MDLSPDRTPTLTKKDVARRVSEQINEPLYRTEPWVNATIEALRDLMADAGKKLREGSADVSCPDDADVHNAPRKRPAETSGPSKWSK